MRPFIIFFYGLLLVSCAHFHVYQPTIEQGNIITDEMVNKLHVGMTRQKVENVMGTPVLKNIFSPQRMNYVYTFKSSKSDQMIQKRITLTFRQGSLVQIDKG